MTGIKDVKRIFIIQSFNKLLSKAWRNDGIELAIVKLYIYAFGIDDMLDIRNIGVDVSEEYPGIINLLAFWLRL